MICIAKWAILSQKLIFKLFKWIFDCTEKNKSHISKPYFWHIFRFLTYTEIWLSTSRGCRVVNKTRTGVHIRLMVKNKNKILNDIWALQTDQYKPIRLNYRVSFSFNNNLGVMYTLRHWILYYNYNTTKILSK